MPHWIVLSPEFAEVTPILYDGSGPIELVCDYAYVIAPTKRAAKVLAIKAWRSNLKSHTNELKISIEGVVEAYGRLKWCNYGLENPFTGLEVKPIEPCDQHGYDFINCIEKCNTEFLNHEG